MSRASGNKEERMKWLAGRDKVDKVMTVGWMYL